MIKRLFLMGLLCSSMIINLLRAQDAIPVDPEFSARIMMTASLTGGQLSPPNANGVLGFAGIVLNESRDELVINISANEEIGQITSAKVMEFNYDDPENNFLVFDLTSKIKSNKINSVLKGFTKDQVAQMVYGNYYLELASTNFPEGAARGTLKLETDKPFTALFSPREDTADDPGDNTLSTPKAIASCGYNVGFSNLEINLFATNLSSSITGVYLYKGLAAEENEDDPVLADLTEFVTNTRLYTNLDISEYLNDVVFNGSYFKIHTIEFPDGELIGQLGLNQNIVLDGWISEAQVVPQVNDEGINGLAVIVMEGDFKTANYYIYTEGLSEDISGLQLDYGALGDPGGVYHDITDQVDGKSAEGVLEFITFDFGHSLLSGNINVRVETESAPGGKIRGQVYRYARDGYLYTFCSNQIESVDVSDGSGVGFMSISRKLDNNHIFMSVKNLTSDISDLGLYNNDAVSTDTYMAGLNFISNGAMEVWWGDNLDSSFSIEDARNLQANNGFFNLETVEYPDGELRGQILTELNCVNDFTNSADLDLTVTAKDAHYSQYDTTHITFAVCNNGFIAATNVKVNAPIPNGFVYCYDNGVDGEYNLFYSEWTIPNLAPGECKSFSFIALAMASGINIDYFAQIKYSDQYDHDSTPGNAYGEINEDDEDGFTILDLENGGSGTGDFNTDLELTMVADRAEAAPYENVNYTLTLTNKGGDNVSYANVDVTIPPGLAYTSHSVERGKLGLYSGEWIVYNLRPNETAILNLELFTLWPSSTITYFAQVHATNEPDVDSTPGNVYDFIVTEDDEARVDITTTAHGLDGGSISSFVAPTYGELYPNPATDEMNLTIQSLSKTNGTILIYSATGKLVHEVQNDFVEGFNTFNFNVSKFATGAYFVKIPELEFTSRFIKK